MDLYQMAVMAASHAAFQLWETVIESIGFKKILGLGKYHAVGLALAINGLFILLASIFIR